MAIYSPSEIREILIKLAQQPPTEVNYIKFERLGVEVKLLPEGEAPIAKDNEVQDQLHNCSICKKKLVSAHLLDLHVSENHDSYFDLQKDKKPMVRF